METKVLLSDHIRRDEAGQDAPRVDGGRRPHGFEAPVVHWIDRREGLSRFGGRVLGRSNTNDGNPHVFVLSPADWTREGTRHA